MTDQSSALAPFRQLTAPEVASLLNPVDPAIERMAAEFMPLTINGLEDRAGYAKVHDARMVVKAHRIAVDKKRKALTEEAREFVSTVNGEAKRILGLLEPIEEHLERQEKAVDDERERIKAEAAAAKAKRLDDRMARLLAIGRQWAPSYVDAIRDEEFESVLAVETTAYEAEQGAKREAEAQAQRLADLAEAARKADEQRAADARREQEALEAAERKREDEARAAERAKIAAERAALERERKAAADAQAARQREIDAQAAELAAERERQTRERLAREDAERKRVEDAKAAELAEARRSDAEKLVAFANTLDSMQLPELHPLTGEALDSILDSTVRAIRDLAAL